MSSIKGTYARHIDRSMFLQRESAVRNHREMPGFSDMFNGCSKKHFMAQDVIYREGERIDKVFIILIGMVKLLSYLPNGRARIIRLHGHNQWLGLESQVGQPYEHTAVAVGDVTLACVSMSKLQQLERENLQQYCQLLKQGYEYLGQADKWIVELSTGDIKPRVARLLDFLSKLEYGKSSNTVKLLKVHEMADMLGVTPESVSRILAEFKRCDVLHKLEVEVDDIYQIDSDRLQYEICQ